MDADMWDASRGSWHNLENTSGSVGEDVVEIRAWRAKTRGSICCIFNLLIGVFYDTSSHFRLIVVYCYFFLFCSLSALCCACLPSGLLFTSFCCPSTGHFIINGLTVPPSANSNLLSPHGSACSLSACLFLFIFLFFFLPVIFPFLLPGTYLVYRCYYY